MRTSDIELQVATMSNETIDYLNVLFGVCKRFGIDYYHMMWVKNGAVANEAKWYNNLNIQFANIYRAIITDALMQISLVKLARLVLWIIVCFSVMWKKMSLTLI